MKLCIISSSRADLSLLIPTINLLQLKFKIHLIITGQHLSKKFGNTFKDINKNIKIFKKIKLNNYDSDSKDILKNISCVINSFNFFFDKNSYDYLLVLGDRFEIFSASLAAFYHNIPIIHIHGGEITEGSLDNFHRYAISKISRFHFVANKQFKKNLILNGIEANNIFVCGSAASEIIKKKKILNKKNLSKHLKINFYKKYIVICFHPSLDSNYLNYIENTLKVLSNFNYNLFISMPNLDPKYKEILKKINKYKKKYKNIIFKKSFGSNYFHSIIYHAECIIGNSSSGIIEAPSLKTPTINIGTRQLGRLSAKSVMNINGSKNSIINSINKIIKLNKYKNKIFFNNPYDNKKNLSQEILKVLNKEILKKVNE